MSPCSPRGSPLLEHMHYCQQKMEPNRAVLSIPGDGQSSMSICIVVHVMKAA